MAGSKWAPIHLGDVSTKIGSGATPRGGSDVYLQKGPFALIRSQNVYNDGFHHDGLAFIGEKHAAELENVEVLKGDVLLNITGDSVARACQVDPGILPARVNQHVAIIRPNPEKLDPRFLRYFLVSPEMQAKLLSWAGSGGTRNALTKGMIESFDVPSPTDILEQRAIANILGTLDDKIDLNRRMNETLEAIARAIFKSWFVDFDPVRAKAEGRDPGLPKHIANLFPDRLVDSELGEIPAGWEILSLDEIANYQNGLALQKYPALEGDEFLYRLKIRELRQGFFNERSDRSTTEIPEECVVYDGDVIFSWSGSLLIDIWTGGTGALNQHLFKVTSEKYPRWFYYFWTKYHLEEFQRIAAGKATTMGHIKRHHMSDAKTVIPSMHLIEMCNDFIAPLVISIVGRRIENRTLRETRDALLPKLISGELRVRDAERFLRQSGL